MRRTNYCVARASGGVQFQRELLIALRAIAFGPRITRARIHSAIETSVAELQMACAD